MATLQLTPHGPFSLAASRRFLEGFTPAGRDPALAAGPLRLAFPVEGSWSTAAVAVQQLPDGTVHADVQGAGVGRARRAARAHAVPGRRRERLPRGARP